MTEKLFTDAEINILLNLLLSAKYMAAITQPDNELEEKLRTLYDKVNNLD